MGTGLGALCSEAFFDCQLDADFDACNKTSSLMITAESADRIENLVHHLDSLSVHHPVEIIVAIVEHRQEGFCILCLPALFFHLQDDCRCTALLDAVGGAIHPIGNVHKYAREEDRPEKTLFVITTDGMENASRKYSFDRLKAMIERQKTKYSWEFLFLGANIDAAREAARLGISADRAANYHADSTGTHVIYETVSEAITQVRCCAAPLSADWKHRVDADYAKRGS